GRLWGALHTPGPSTAGIMGTSVSATPRAVCRRLQSGREGRPHGEPLEAELATRDLVIRVAGEAGEGVLSTGQLITQAAARAGFGVLTDSVPPAEIKGGHSFFQIRLSDSRLYSRGDQLDILLAFNEEAFVKNIRELAPGGVFIYDSAEFTPPQSGDYRSYPLPLTDLAKNQLQFELGKNVVAVGAVAGLFGLEIEVLN